MEKQSNLNLIIQHYLGCDVFVFNPERHTTNIGRLIGIHNRDNSIAFCDVYLQNVIYTMGLSQFKPILRPLYDMKIEEGAWCLQQTFFPQINYPISDFKLQLVGDGKNPKISINNDWFTESLTFGSTYGSIWSAENQPCHNIKISALLFAYLCRNAFDLFGLITSEKAISSVKK